MDVPRRSSSSTGRRKSHRSSSDAKSLKSQKSRRSSSNRKSKTAASPAASPSEANPPLSVSLTTSPETSISSGNNHKNERRRSSRSRNKNDGDRRQELLKQRCSRRRSSATKRSSSLSKKRSSRSLQVIEDKGLREEEKLKMVSKMVQEMETGDLEVIGKLLETKEDKHRYHHHRYNNDEEKAIAVATKERSKKKKKKTKQQSGKWKKLTAWFHQLSMPKKYGFVGCVTFGMTAIVAVVIIFLSLAAKTLIESIGDDGYKPVLDIIKYAPLLTGNVTIGSLPNSANLEDYYLNINFVNFSIFDEEDLVLYITRGSSDTLEETNRIRNHIRYPKIASRSMPMKLPENFWPGEYNAILLSDENQEGRKIELVQSPLEVMDDERDFLQPSGAPTSSMAPTDRPSVTPTNLPSVSPTHFPTYSPSFEPSLVPSISPTTSEPSVSPTNNPTITPRPTTIESEPPTDAPSQNPTANDRLTRLEEILVPTIVNEFVSNGNSPQARAIQWLDSNPQVDLKMSEEQVLQLYALVVQQFSTTPSQWNLDSSKSSMCEWNQVLCNSQGKIVQLDLKNLQLQGSLCTELGLLTSLTAMNLGYNRLRGNIPTQFELLTKLQVLQVENNRLTGPVPDMSKNQGPMQILNLVRVVVCKHRSIM